MSQDTIFAPASGAGRAAIAVVRLSGPVTRGVLEAMAGGLPSPRRMALRALRDPASGEVLDRALVLWMPAPESFTGEDQAELHIHGGLAVRAAVLRALSGIPGLKAAEPGEFTRRAFLNGRMDLSAVEGLADLIDAETEAQRRQALRQLEGRLGSLVEGWRERLIECLALLEAALDFSDEADVAADAEGRAGAIARALAGEIAGHLAEAGRGERLREGFTVVIAGPPNAGKSTLLNALARRDVAIVSAVPGTTRDAIEVRCDLAGLPVTFVDTAGLRETGDPIEMQGVSRARAHVEKADLVLWLAAPDGGADIGSARGPEDGFDAGLKTAPKTAPTTAPAIRVATKSDLAPAPSGADIVVSAKTGEGLSSLLDRIAALLQESLGAGDAVITRERHRRAFEDAGESLARAGAALGQGHAELAAEDVRLALRALGRVTGRVDVEEILDRLFAAFCIGK
ncbi:MAG TPA: tRNA uridine-5-carboxymethylaminomethyl(34) synthesis GTPase MnmE [Beijerinckiaceae bacterium]|jgi:tRNA modification GTPase